MGASGIGSLLVNIWLGSRSNIGNKGMYIIGGAALFGLSLVTFGLTSKYIGSYPLALVILFGMGMFTSAHMLSTQSSLQMMVPDQVRGRVMGFYGMTWSIMPLGGTVSGALASIAIMLLELFVAFLQAFIFTFLTTLFIGMSVVFHHEEHGAEAQAH